MGLGAMCANYPGLRFARPGLSNLAPIGADHATPSLIQVLSRNDCRLIFPRVGLTLTASLTSLPFTTMRMRSPWQRAFRGVPFAGRLFDVPRPMIWRWMDPVGASVTRGEVP